MYKNYEIRKKNSFITIKHALSLLTHILGNLTFLNKQVGAKDKKKKRYWQLPRLRQNKKKNYSIYSV